MNSAEEYYYQQLNDDEDGLPDMVSKETCIKMMEEYAYLNFIRKDLMEINPTISSMSPHPKKNIPTPPLSQYQKEGITHFCAICGSTMTKRGFLNLFGERLCDNLECPNSKSRERK